MKTIPFVSRPPLRHLYQLLLLTVFLLALPLRAESLNLLGFVEMATLPGCPQQQRCFLFRVRENHEMMKIGQHLIIAVMLDTRLIDSENYLLTAEQFEITDGGNYRVIISVPSFNGIYNAEMILLGD